jgi:hypothetical protein
MTPSMCFLFTAPLAKGQGAAGIEPRAVCQPTHPKGRRKTPRKARRHSLYGRGKANQGIAEILAGGTAELARE